MSISSSDAGASSANAVLTRSPSFERGLRDRALAMILQADEYMKKHHMRVTPASSWDMEEVNLEESSICSSSFIGTIDDVSVISFIDRPYDEISMNRTPDANNIDILSVTISKSGTSTKENNIDILSVTYSKDGTTSVVNSAKDSPFPAMHVESNVDNLGVTHSKDGITSVMQATKNPPSPAMLMENEVDRLSVTHSKAGNTSLMQAAKSPIDILNTTPPEDDAISVITTATTPINYAGGHQTQRMEAKPPTKPPTPAHATTNGLAWRNATAPANYHVDYRPQRPDNRVLITEGHLVHAGARHAFTTSIGLRVMELAVSTLSSFVPVFLRKKYRRFIKKHQPKETKKRVIEVELADIYSERTTAQQNRIPVLIPGTRRVEVSVR